MMRKTLLLYIFLSLFVLASCEKQIDDGKGKSDTEQPVTPPDDGDEENGDGDEPEGPGDDEPGDDEGGSGGGDSEGDEGGSGGDGDDDEGSTDSQKGTKVNPYTVHDFLTGVDMTPGEICGYIVGDITRGWSNAKFEAPFQDEPIAILLADSPNETAKEAVMYLKLDKNKGERAALSLTLHPEYLHKKIQFYSGSSAGTSYGIRGIDKLAGEFVFVE